MDKLCVFTIVAKNYIGLAELLGKSLHAMNPNIVFNIVVADKFEDNPKCLPSNVYMGSDILSWNEEEYLSYAFKYDLTEFCTALKPGSILYFFRQGYDKVIYFDPDIFIFSSIYPIYELLDNYQVVLTPHIAQIHKDYHGDHPEWMINCNGIFNLGFAAFRKTEKTIRFLEWWEKRLKSDCFADRVIGDFTDQKWMDWVPAFFTNTEFYSSPHLGMNLAPWNFFEREVANEDGRWMVRVRGEKTIGKSEDLIFVHFSGFKYKLLKEGIIDHTRNNDLEKYEDLKPIYEIYGEYIKKNAKVFDSFIDQPYTYNYFDDGTRVEFFHRRLYDGLIKEGKKYDNPFSSKKGSLLEGLKKNGIISKDGNGKFSRASVKDIDSKKNMLSKLYSFLFRIMGYSKYVLLTKAHLEYSRPATHTFLMKNK